MPGSSSDLSRIGVDDSGGSGPVEEKVNIVLSFLGRGYLWAKGQGRWAPKGPTSPPGAARKGASRGGEAASWPLSVSSSVFWNVPFPKIIPGCFFSNSENISLSTFLKPKTEENRELALWYLVNRLVLENA